MNNPFSLEGKTILVTGASSGIGRVTAIECSKMGASVVITGRNEDRLNETFNQMEGNNHFQIMADLCSNEEIEKLVDRSPALDGCANNAGITHTLLTQFITEEALREVLQVNTIAPILLTKMLVRKKKLHKRASIVFTSSVSGVYGGYIGNVIYSTSKGAINGFVKNAALDLAAKNIRVNSVCPAMIDTALWDTGTLTEEQIQADIQRYPLRRYGRPEEVAYAIIYLLSDASAWVTGTNLLIDGGFTLA